MSTRAGCLGIERQSCLDGSLPPQHISAARYVHRRFFAGGFNSELYRFGIQACTGMLKIRSDGLTTKMGIKEPQLAPIICDPVRGVNDTGTLLASDIPWTNFLGQNPGIRLWRSNG